MQKCQTTQYRSVWSQIDVNQLDHQHLQIKRTVLLFGLLTTKTSTAHTLTLTQTRAQTITTTRVTAVQRETPTTNSSINH